MNGGGSQDDEAVCSLDVRSNTFNRISTASMHTCPIFVVVVVVEKVEMVVAVV